MFVFHLSGSNKIIGRDGIVLIIFKNMIICFTNVFELAYCFEYELHLKEAEMFEDHMSGFERERKFKMILYQARCDCPVLKARTVSRVIAHVAPNFIEGLSEVKPCARILRYIGCGCIEPICPHGNEFFEMGKVYRSIDFNGGTYAIEGFEGRIGSSYFEWISK